MKVEYLIIIDGKVPFCRDKNSFDSFLQSNADITIKGNNFKHKKLTVKYELQGGETEADKNRFFHIKLKCSDDSKIEEFHELLSATSKLLYMASEKKPQILWDDVGFYYSEKAYPIIHEVENLMRKLITKFMLTNVGLGWTKDTIPEGLKSSTRTDAKNNNNYLYETDFKDLATFLFDEYKTLDVQGLVDKIKTIEKTTSDISLAEFKGFVPQSNWDRYFKQHVDCEGSYIQTRWSKLYLLRCKVAHNNFFTKTDFEQLAKLVKEIKPKIEGAISNLDKIEVPEEEREELAEVVASKNSALYYDYIHKWKSVEESLSNLYVQLTEKEVLEIPYVGRNRAPHICLKELVNRDLITKDMYMQTQDIMRVRNMIVHGSAINFSPMDITIGIKKMNELLDILSFIENDS